jgi:hypothetical protein
MYNVSLFRIDTMESPLYNKYILIKTGEKDFYKAGERVGVAAD